MTDHKTSNQGLAFEDALASTMTDKRVEVLRAIGRLGSISEAARFNQVSYKAAWQAIETLSNLAGVALLEKSVGGSGGGGARLTAAGHALLQAADRLNEARTLALAQIRGQGHCSGATIRGIVGMGLRTSMRNQLPCVVSEVEKSTGAPRVWLELPDGQRLSSRLTLESIELLDLKPGMQVLALCKATAVAIAPTIVAVGEINLVSGKILKRSKQNSDGQVSMAIGHGLQLSGFAKPEMTLKLKQPAMAAVAESAIVIGLA